MGTKPDPSISAAISRLTRVGPYHVGKALGSGCTGEVKLATHADTGHQVAIKIISKSLLIEKPSMFKKVEREIAVMKALDHPHVLHLLDVYESTDFLFLVLEYVEGGELFDFLVSRGALRPEEALYFFQQIVEGIDYCHSHMICHRDLKPENLLLDKHMCIKIADFGMATLMKDDFLLTSCGSPHYASPEVVMGHKYDGRKSDIWSCGVILYAMVTGKLPFDDENIRRLLSKVKNGVFTIPPHIPGEICDLIRKMLISDPQSRITIPDIKKHPFWNSRKYISPTLIIPVEDRLELVEVVQVEEVDEEIVLSLMSLGWGQDDEEGLISRLRTEKCLELVFYRILETQKFESSKSPQGPPAESPPSTIGPPPSLDEKDDGSLEEADKSEEETPDGKLPTLGKEDENKSEETHQPPRERVRLPRDKRQGSVKNLIALLGRRKSINDLKQKEVMGNERESRIRTDEAIEKSPRPKKRGSGEKPKLSKGQSKGSLGSRLGKAFKPRSAQRSASPSPEPPSANSPPKSARGPPPDRDRVANGSSDPQFRQRTNTSYGAQPPGGRSSLWKNLSSKNVRSFLHGEATPSSSPRPTENGGKVEDPQVNRSWFSNFLKQKREPSGATHVQLTTEQSQLHAVIQFINVLHGFSDVTFVYDSKKWRFDVRHVKIDCRFTITLKLESEEETDGTTAMGNESPRVAEQLALPPSATSSSPSPSCSSSSCSSSSPAPLAGSSASPKFTSSSPKNTSSSPKNTSSTSPKNTFSTSPKISSSTSPKKASSQKDKEKEKEEATGHDYLEGSLKVRISEDVTEGKDGSAVQKTYSAIIPDSPGRHRKPRKSLSIRIDKFDPSVAPSVSRTLIEFDFKQGDIVVYQTICIGLRKLVDL